MQQLLSFRQSNKKEKGFKPFLYWWLESEYNSKRVIVDLFIFLIIVISVASTVIELSVDKKIPEWIADLDIVLTLFFAVEYLTRFYIATDFTKEARSSGVWYAIRQKLKWMISFSAIIDLLALVPSIRFMRTIRIFRILRVLKFLRLLRMQRLFGSVNILMRTMKESAAIYVTLFAIVFFIILFGSLGIYIAENEHDSKVEFTDKMMYALEKIGIFDSSPKTILGKIFASVIVVGNIFFVSFLISLINTKMQSIITNMKEGKSRNLKLREHIVLCGYTKGTENVLEEIKTNRKLFDKRIVLVSEQSNPDLKGVIFIKGDYSELSVLQSVNIKEASLCIIFAEQNEGESIKNVDLRTVLTVFNIETLQPEVHTIAEIINKDNAEIIKDKIKGDEIIYKEIIDAHLITNCIRHKYVSGIVYDLLDQEGNSMEEASLKELKLPENITVRELKKEFIERDYNFLGYIDNDQTFLAPKKDVVLKENYRIIFIAS